MAYENHTVPRLRELLTEKEVWGYSGKKKAELIAMLGASDTQPSPQPQTFEPLRPQCTKPPNPTRPPPPSPTRPPFRLPILPPTHIVYGMGQEVLFLKNRKISITYRFLRPYTHYLVKMQILQT